MRLKALLSGVALLGGSVDEDVEISGISYDTRTIRPGELFVALTGYKTDGHRFLHEAVEKGAAAVICHKAPDGPGPWLIAGDTRAALAAVSANWFGRPADALTVIGVTGTKRAISESPISSRPCWRRYWGQRWGSWAPTRT